MLLDFYGLREQPFGPTPDPRYFYLSPTHEKAATSLRRGLISGSGFLALIARPGMGKTSLLFQMLDELNDGARTAFLFQTQCNDREFLQSVLHDFGISIPDGSLASIHARLNEFLAAEAASGRRVVLVIDEAQNLSESVLETVRLLSNFETPRAKLLQVVLAGQPQLAAKLRRPSLAQLLQRISVLCHLRSLNTQEVAEFINHRLRVAGHAGTPLFSNESLSLIAHRSRGIPRLINDICFACLTLGHSMDRRTIDTRVVEGVLRDLSLASLMHEVLPPSRPPVSKRAWTSAILPAVLRTLRFLP
jgi:general secretion pathway protein A